MFNFKIYDKRTENWKFGAFRLGALILFTPNSWMSLLIPNAKLFFQWKNIGTVLFLKKQLSLFVSILICSCCFDSRRTSSTKTTCNEPVFWWKAMVQVRFPTFCVWGSNFSILIFCDPQYNN